MAARLLGHHQSCWGTNNAHNGFRSRFDRSAPAENFYENAIRFDEFFSQLVIPLRVDCSFPTALARAISRAQEGLSPANTIAAYETIYFPAQRIHMAQDKPRENADLIFDNDTYPAGK